MLVERQREKSFNLKYMYMYTYNIPVMHTNLLLKPLPRVFQLASLMETQSCDGRGPHYELRTDCIYQNPSRNMNIRYLL